MIFNFANGNKEVMEALDAEIAERKQEDTKETNARKQEDDKINAKINKSFRKVTEFITVKEDGITEYFAVDTTPFINGETVKMPNDIIVSRYNGMNSSSVMLDKGHYKVSDATSIVDNNGKTWYTATFTKYSGANARENMNVGLGVSELMNNLGTLKAHTFYLGSNVKEELPKYEQFGILFMGRNAIKTSYIYMFDRVSEVMPVVVNDPDNVSPVGFYCSNRVVTIVNENATAQDGIFLYF